MNLVERLRRNCHFDDCQEAADEIERLRDDLAISEENFKTQMEVHYKDRDRIAKLEKALQDAWGFANHGQTQCNQCENTYLVIDAALEDE